MAESGKTNLELLEENQLLRAQIAQFQDRLDHLMEHGALAKAQQAADLLHREVMAVVADSVLITDEAGKLTYVSPNAHLIFGHSAADIQKQGRINFVLPHDLFDPDLLDQRGEIANISCLIRDSVGRARNLLVTVRKVEHNKGRVMYVCRDVTERIKIELDHDLLSLSLERRVEEQTRELRESRERYRRLVEGLRDEYFFYATDVNGVITYMSPALHTITGRTPEEVVGHNWREFVDPGDPAYRYLEELDQLRRSGVPTPLYSTRVRHANGDELVLEFRDMTVHDADGRIVSIEGICKDVTLRHRAEEALRKAHEQLEQRVQERTAELLTKNEQLRQSQERYFSVIQDHLEFIVRWRGDGTRTFVNDSYCKHYQALSDDLTGSSFMTSIVEEDRHELQQKLAEVSLSSPVVVHEHRVVMPDGRVAWEHWTHRALFNPLGELIEYQSVGCDVTERRRREDYNQARAEAAQRLNALTDRECDVMRLVVAGDANKVVARKLGLSIKTIEKHRSSLMKKLHVRSVPELVRIALMFEHTGNS
ncbi:MAG: PAS domain S-box protein [Pirellulales bacterium]